MRRLVYFFYDYQLGKEKIGFASTLSK